MLENTVLVLEVKSTYRRNSKREVLRYKHNTLRKAGIQIQRKTEAVKYLLETDESFRVLFAIDKPSSCLVIGWIADTSIEYDHEYFNGHLKVSVEELHIALNDDADLLLDFAELIKRKEDNEEASLYPDGFSVWTLVNVVEDSLLWSSKLVV